MGKGVLISPTAHGNALLGPSAENIEDGTDTRTTRQGLDFVLDKCRLTWPKVTTRPVITTFSGVRAHPATDDFIIGPVHGAPDNAFEAIGIESPGLTSALPIARRVVGLIREKEELTPNPAFNPVHRGIRRFHDASREEQAALIAQNPDYGEIICRCETITRAEIVAAIHNPLGVSTVNGIKVRTRASMGRCQGGYCETRITALIREELGKAIGDVRLTNGSSAMFTGTVKGGDRA